MIQLSHTTRRQGINTIRGYNREISSREVALFFAVLVLPFALLAAQSI